MSTLPPMPLNILMMGDDSVGKSSLTAQFITGQFYDSYECTVEHLHPKKILVDEIEYTLQIIDTVSYDETIEIKNKNIKKCNAYILIYSVTSRSSFNEIPIIRDRIYHVLDKEITKDNIPIILVGNKIDLKSSTLISTEEGLQLSNKLGDGIPFIEVTALKNVDQIFIEVIRYLNKIQSSSSSSSTTTNKKQSITQKFKNLLK